LVGFRSGGPRACPETDRQGGAASFFSISGNGSKGEGVPFFPQWFAGSELHARISRFAFAARFGPRSHTTGASGQNLASQHPLVLV